MFKRLCYVLAALTVMLFVVSACSGNGTDGPFDRFTAQALDSDGNPLGGVAVLVNGMNTGVAADQSGYFQLDESDFTHGVNTVNRVSIGEKGIVYATTELVPSRTRQFMFQYKKSNKSVGAVTGYTYDDYSATPLENVKMILMNEDLGLFQAQSGPFGEFNFDNIPEGNYRLTARHENYSLGIAGVQVQSGNTSYQGVSLQPVNKARYTDGVMVQGYIYNSDTMSPVEGVSISMTVDTGYIGMPDPWMDYEDEGDPRPGEEMPIIGGSMSSMPPMYDPQWQETTTDSNGFFAFEDPAIGYSIYLNYWKDGYLSGNDYVDIYNLEDDITLSLTIKPLIMTSATGTVIDELGAPVPNAYVEFIFAGEEIYYYGDDMMGPALGMPSDPGWDGFREMVDENQGFGGGNSAPQAPPGMMGGPDGDPLDNPVMQRYRWENQNGREGASMTSSFTGFYSTKTDDNGEFAFESLPAGAYYTFVNAYRHQATSDNVMVVENQSENVFEFVIPNIPVGSVFGVVTDEYGAVVADALVNCVQPFVDPFTYTDSNGEFRIDNIPVGTWIVSAFKYGYLTDSVESFIGENAEIEINLQIESYTPPEVTTVFFTGRVVDGSTGVGVEGARMIFTTADNQFFSDMTSGADGYYSGELIATEYNVLIQVSGFEDLYQRFWVDSLYPQYDFYLWSFGGGWGPWGGIMPGGPGMEDGGFNGSTGGEAPPQFDPLSDPDSQFDPNEYFNGRRG